MKFAALVTLAAVVAAQRSMTLYNNCGTDLTVSFTSGFGSASIGSVAVSNGGSQSVSYPSGWSGNVHACAGTSTSCGPVTLAEFTLNGGTIDTYDVSLINGFNFPLEMRPINPPLNAANPYSCGTPGAVTPNTATGPCSWAPKVPAAYFKSVTNVGASCTADSDCTGSQVCGLNINTPLGTSLNCGTFLGYNGPATTCTFVDKCNLGSNTDANFELFGCVGGNIQSCYSAGAGTSCCGCENWASLGLDVPSETANCVSSNPNWTSKVLPSVQWVKEMCPTGYSYPYDDMSSTFTCTSTVEYALTWCPNGVTFSGNSGVVATTTTTTAQVVATTTTSVTSPTSSSSGGFTFQSGSNGSVEWASGCDWTGGDIANVETTGALCGGACVAYSGCTHFTWTDYNGGTCWLKNNGVASTPVENSSTGDICGYVV
ncbi:hypothetical protein HK100_009247 [Physocladia obscura]|uniref:Uncharacterized protein n=1 Tax=Physocladia obscura TaxID=109957 RepID=A0AAD5XEA4_9FUNG|nr:hypothetical protein HK100_009247 [Physocladia obscura]